MDSGGSTSYRSGGSGLRPGPKPFKIDHTSLPTARVNSRMGGTASPSTDSDSDRVGHLQGAVSDRGSPSSNGIHSLDTGLKIDRTQSLMTPMGYTPGYKSQFSRIQPSDRTRSLMTESSIPTPVGTRDSHLPKMGPRPSLTHTALTRGSSSDNIASQTLAKEEISPRQGNLRSSHSSLIRAASATPKGEILSASGEESQEDTRHSRIPLRRAAPLSSSDENEPDEPQDQRRSIKSPVSLQSRSGRTTPYSVTSSTPATSPMPKATIDDRSPPDRRSITRIDAENQRRVTEEVDLIIQLKTALELTQRKGTEDKKTIEELRNQLITCKEEKGKEDPVLKAALEDALREIRENKEVMTSLTKEITDLKKANDDLKEKVTSLQGSLQDNDGSHAKDLDDYHSRVVALEEENLLLKKEKENVSDQLAAASAKLNSHEDERMKDKEVLESSLRAMEAKVSNSQRDKLYAAIKTEDIDAIEELLQSPIDLDAVIANDDSGQRPIHLVAGNIALAPIMNQLIDLKVDVNATDSDNETALHIAARTGRGRIVRALLEANADWTILNVEGWSPVQVATAVGNVSALDEFRKHDPGSLKSKDTDGSTLLHYSCANNQKKVSKWLVRHGSSKRRRDAFGLSATDYKEAAKGDDGLLTCFGGSGNKLANEQLPRLQLESYGSMRRSRNSTRSLPAKALSDVDQSSRSVISEKQYPVSNETDTELGREKGYTTEDEHFPHKSLRETPVPPAETSDEMISAKQVLKGMLSLPSDSGRSSVSLDTGSIPAVHPRSKTPPPSQMSRIDIPRDESFSEDQLSDVSVMSSQRSFKERLPTGLPNLGNTCYLNTILQCLYYTKPLSDNFINSRFRDNINKKSNFNGDFCVAFGNVVKALRTGKQTYDAVMKMKEVVGRYDSSYVSDNNIEAHHFVLQFLQWLHHDLSKDISPDENMSQDQVSLISTLFYGVSLTMIVCQETGVELSRSEETFSVLSLPVGISGLTDLKELLDRNFKPQLLVWSCSECEKEHMCLKKKKILRLPSNLIIHLDRKTELSRNIIESRSHITYPQDDLSLSEYLLEPQSQRGAYDLYAQCNRKGHGLTSHHTACCMIANPPIWCFFNDLMVKPIPAADVLQQTDAYILFYKMSSQPYQSTGV